MYVNLLLTSGTFAHILLVKASHIPKLNARMRTFSALETSMAREGVCNPLTGEKTNNREQKHKLPYMFSGGDWQGEN